MIEIGGLGANLFQARLLGVRGSPIIFARTRERNMRFIGKELNGLGKLHAIDLHKEAENIAAFPATKTVPQLR